jgi:exosortase
VRVHSRHGFLVEYLRMKKHPHLSSPTVLVILAGVSLLFWWHALVDTMRLALESDSYTHLLLIVPLSGVLIYLDSKALRSDPQRSPRVGSALLVLALVLGWYARWRMPGAPYDVRLSLSIFGLVTWWIASVLVGFGTRTTIRSIPLPLYLLFLFVPLPEAVVNLIIRALQFGTAWTAALLFRVIGEPIQRDGILLSLTNLDIEVATECSSIRSSWFLAITTILLAHLFLRTWWRKALLIAAAIPLAVMKNGLRVFVIAELGTRVDPGFLDGDLHHRGGIVFLGIAVVAAGILLWALRRNELPTQKSSVAVQS